MLQYFNHLIFPNPLKISICLVKHSSLMNPISPHKSIFVWESLHHCTVSTSGGGNSSQLAHNTGVGREEIFGSHFCSKHRLLLIRFGMKLFCTVLTFFLNRAGHQLRGPRVSVKDTRKSKSITWGQQYPPS